LNTLPRIKLGFFPTPIVEMRRLSAYLGGPRILVKRDDQSGLGFGGNKVRKLEYLIGDALNRGADTLITGGSSQSNHCRQTAAAAAMRGLYCHLALGGEEPDEAKGNLLLNHFFGAEIHWCGEHRKGERIPDICESLLKQGKKPYVIPYGGSNPIGAAGFVKAVEELADQQQKEFADISHIVFASSSGGTHAGLMVGNALLQKNTALVGIAIDKEEMQGLSLDRFLVNLANQTAKRIDFETRFDHNDLTLVMDYTGDGYGIVGAREKEALSITAAKEGLLLDPVYTGRAMGALIDMIRTKVFSSRDTLLFWHTGGTPALFAYGQDILCNGALS